MPKKASPTYNLRGGDATCYIWNDLRFGLRTLRRSPLFTSVAVLSLVLGIGANTAIFSLLNQVMLRMLPVAEPERLVVFHTEGQRRAGFRELLRAAGSEGHYRARVDSG